MDFALEPSTAGYERYVSESESTDGEGDASAKHPKPHQHQLPSAPTLPHAGGAGATNADAEFCTEATNGNHLGYEAPSIFSRLAASWKTKKSGNSTRGGTRSSSGGHHGNGRRGRHTARGGGTLWKDIREGSPRGDEDGDGRGFGGGGMR